MNFWLRSTKRYFASACVVLISIVGGSFAVLMLLTWLSLQVPTAKINARLDNAFEQGTLTDIDFRVADSIMGYSQYNDCLILLMLSLRSGTILEEIISPKIVFSQPIETEIHNSELLTECQILKHAVTGAWSEPLRKVELRYNRYLHGNRTVAALLLQVFELDQTRKVLKNTLYLVLSLGIIGGLWQERRLRSRGAVDTGDVSAGLGITAICGTLLAFYGLPYFGQSLAHAPGDLVIFLFLLISLRLRWLMLSMNRFYACVTLYGCLVGWFDLLTGGIPVGLAALVSVLALQMEQTTPMGEYFIRVIGAIAAYIAAIAASLALKLSMAGAVFGSSVWIEFFDQLVYRIAGGHEEGDSGNLAQAFDIVLNASWSIGYGSARMGTALIIGSIPVFALASLYVYRRRPGRMIAAKVSGITISVLVVAIWIAIFKSHAILHPDWMARILVWPIAVAAVAVVWLITAVRQEAGMRQDATAKSLSP